MTCIADMPLPDTVIAWQCIGCGRLDAPAACVGICQDRKVELVHAADYAEIAHGLVEANVRIAALESVLKKLAHVTPRKSAWQSSYLALQREARRILTVANG